MNSGASSTGGRGEGYPVTPQVSVVPVHAPHDNNNDYQNNNNNNFPIVTEPSPSSSDESIQEHSPQYYRQDEEGWFTAESGICVEDRRRVQSSSTFVYPGVEGTVQFSHSRPSSVNPQLAEDLIACNLSSDIPVPTTAVVSAVYKDSAVRQPTLEAPVCTAASFDALRGIHLSTVSATVYSNPRANPNHNLSTNPYSTWSTNLLSNPTPTLALPLLPTPTPSLALTHSLAHSPPLLPTRLTMLPPLVSPTLMLA